MAWLLALQGMGGDCVHNLNCREAACKWETEGDLIQNLHTVSVKQRNYKRIRKKEELFVNVVCQRTQALILVDLCTVICVVCCP